MSTPKEKPILMQSSMVLAILAGSKTQTRRILSPSTSLIDGHPTSKAKWANLDFSAASVFVDKGPSPAGNAGPYLHVLNRNGNIVSRVYPRKAVGDVLWVKETHGRWGRWFRGKWRFRDDAVGFERDGGLVWAKYPALEGWHKRPSIFMPRWASRITLKITGVRIERLNSISLKDAKAEGLEILEVTDETVLGQKTGKKIPHYKFYGKELERLKQQTSNPIWAYETLWESINGKGSWARNDFVWVLTFKRV